jgi:hypothetical protein
MPFLHISLFWWGAAAASVPIIIHLLNRRRFKVRDWAAMRFLLESVRKNRRRVRIEELILMALRTLAILLLALVVGRFTGCTSANAIPLVKNAQAVNVFLLDDSISMGQKIGDASGFAKAAGDLGDMLKAVPSDDRVAVLLTSRPQRSDALFDLNMLSNADSLAAHVRSLKPSDTTTNLSAALRSVADLLAGQEMDKRLYIFSDFRRQDYSNAAELDGIRKQLKALEAAKVSITLLNYGVDPAGNLTVEGIEPLDRLAVAGVPLRVQLKVRNNGPAPAKDVAVNFTTPDPDRPGEEIKIAGRYTPDGSDKSSPTIPLIEPGQVGLIQAAFPFAKPGMGIIKAQLPGDSLLGDNTAYLSVQVREARKVLLVDGEPDPANPDASETHALAVAIDPNGDHLYGNAAEQLSYDRLGDVDVNNYDVVVLANVPEIPEAQLKSLTEYVQRGGGLAIYTGERCNVQFYRDVLYQGGNGLAPVSIGVPEDVRKRRDNPRPVRLMQDSIANDEVMYAFQGSRAQFTKYIRFYTYSPVEQTALATSGPASQVRVLARFADSEAAVQNSPAVVARPYGAGNVMMILSTADLAWNDWPKDYTYLPFINDMINTLSRPSAGTFTARVGQPIRFLTGADMAAGKALMRTPSDKFLALEGQRQNDQRELVFEKTDQAGIYQLGLDLADEHRDYLFARNIDGREGVLDRLAEKDLRSAVGVEFRYVDKVAPQGSEQQDLTPRREYWKLALALMLAVLALEVFLGQRFGHYQG